jgi:hypothetical protein
MKRALTIAFLLPLFCSAQPAMDHLQRLLDTHAIIQTVDAVGRDADDHHWKALEARFIARPGIDYSAMTGTPGGPVATADLVQQWAAFLPGFDRTQHMLTNHEVTFPSKEEAEVASYFLAIHVLKGATGGDVWQLSGRYLHRLTRTPEGWRITYLRMTPTFSDGNQNLPALARARMQTHPSTHSK